MVCGCEDKGGAGMSSAWRSLLVGMAGACVLVAGLCSAVAAGAQGCPNEAIRLEQGVTGLPDCRAYEMVSPAYQEGEPFGVSGLAPGGGQAIIFGDANVAGLAGEGERTPEAAVYLDTRGADGWRLSPLNASLSAFVGQLPVAQEPESGASLWMQHTPHQPAPTQDLYVRSGTDVSGPGLFSLVGPLTPGIPGVESPEESDVIETTNVGTRYHPIAATSNYQHIVVNNETKSQAPHGLYEYSALENSQPVAVNVTGATKGSTSLLGGGECAILGGNDEGKSSEYNALSGDGETVFFTTPCEGSATEVYARKHGSLVSPGPAETVDVSASECTVACGEQSGRNFEGASENGEKVFFTSTQKLTNDAVDLTAGGDATAGSRAEDCPAAAEGCNLYVYDFSQEQQ
jgi:hypothetical protein